MTIGRDLQDAADERMAVGDVASSARGSGARANRDKLEMHQLPMFALRGVVRVLMYGARKYAKANWAKGMKWSVCYDCMMRHMDAWQRGEEFDPESGLPHLDHALTNLIFLSAYRDLFPEGDDRFKEFAPGGVKVTGDKPPIVGPGILVANAGQEAHAMSLPPPEPRTVVAVTKAVGYTTEYTIYSDGTWESRELEP